MPQETIPSKEIKEIMHLLKNKYEISMDGDDLDDYDNGFRAGLLVAHNICKEYLITNQQKGA